MKLNRKIKYGLWIALTIVAVIAVFIHAPISQDRTYHDLADKRVILGIPNGCNVLTNIPFIVIGIVGIAQLRKTSIYRGMSMVYGILFAGIFFTGWGSAWYHLAPDNNTLVWDRIPMTLAFMSLLSATISEHISVKLGSRLLWPLLLIGIGSVLYWHYTERAGMGDLRLYGVVQFYPLFFIPFILLLFPAPAFNRGLRQFIGVLGWYTLAKVFEYFDKEVYHLTHFISGHSLKHLAAAAATWYLIRMFQINYVVSRDNKSLPKLPVRS